MTLVDILNRCGSDKANQHSYGLVYEDMFAPLRERARSVLEIGVYRGASIRAWHEFFHNASIVGVDIAPRAECVIPKTRANLVVANATDPDFARELATAYGPFDLVIDDGSHEPGEQRAALILLLPHVRDGGLYVIEDARSLNIALDLASTHQGMVIDMRAIRGVPDDILVIFKREVRR